jgi:hypothetical protein
MTSKIVWAATTVIIAILIIGAVTYYLRVLAPTPASPPSTSTSRPLQTPTDKASLNWAGYAVAYNFSDPKPVITGVSGSWTVPEVKVSQNDTFSAMWVGIGGTFGHDLIQTGTQQDSINGVTYYSAWYELLPFDSVTITTMDISPGDAITTSINLTDPTLNTWSIEVNDLSTGQSFNQDFVYDSSRLSAEWIVERPDINSVLSEVADFESVTFSNCTVVMNNQLGALGYFPSSRSFMYNMRGTRLVDVSNFFNDGTSFTVEHLTSQ